MQSLISKLLFILLFQSFASGTLAHVYLDYPQGGETFEANTIVTIEWHIAIPHDQLNWDLLFSSDGGITWQPIQLDLPVSQLTYSWVVPSIATSQARISIIQDNTDMDYQDESMNFTIVPMSNTPYFDMPAQNLNLECNVNNQQADIQNWLNNHGGATAAGFCNDLIWTHDYVGLSNDCGATGNAFVTFTVADSCGSAETSAYLTVSDLQAPMMQASASDMVVECGDPNNTASLNNWLANHGGAIASDACSNIIWTYQATEQSNGCGITGSTSVIFIATDECGNSSTTAADFSVEDNLVPTILGPAQNYTISCGTPDQQTILQNWLNSYGGALAFDDCGNVNWSNNYSTLSDGCGLSGNAAVTFVASDDCGNSSMTSAIFAVVDNTAPVINVGASNTTINCGDLDAQMQIQNWLSNHGGANASDECGSVLWTNDFPPLADTCDITRIISVNFTAQDECGNSDTTNANITLSTITGTVNLDVDDFNFKISPNPASDMLKITFEKIESFPIHISLYDSYGRLVLSGQAIGDEFYIPVERYAHGIYILLAGTSHSSYSSKVVIN